MVGLGGARGQNLVRGDLRWRPIDCAPSSSSIYTDLSDHLRACSNIMIAADVTP